MYYYPMLNNTHAFCSTVKSYTPVTFDNCTSEQVLDVRVTVKALTSQYKKDPDVAFVYPMPTPVYETTGTREIDPEYVGVQIFFQGNDKRDFVFNMLMSREFTKRLNLMVGDKLTLKIVKVSH